jgi:hypothetical protein
MELYLVRILSVVCIALVYMLFDVLNKRNVPTLFAYATLVYGAVLTVLYLEIHMILVSTAIALVVLGIGYIIYRIGQLGAADVIEFAALSLIIPIQGIPLIARNVSQYGLPFILSLLLNAGIVALVLVPIYYLPKAKHKLKRPLASYINKGGLFRAILLAAAYLAFIAFAILVVGIGYGGIAVLLLMLVSSCIVMLFSVPITHSMVEYVPVSKFEEGDIIAFNLMDRKSISRLRARIKGFDRLLTGDLIKEMQKKRIKDSLPVYKEAMPFALPIFIAVLISIALGNLLFFIFAF